MATKRITSEDLVLNLILNIDQVDKGNKELLNKLYALDRATRDLEVKMMKLNQEKRALSKTSKTYAADVAKIDLEMEKLRAQILLNRDAMMALRKEIGAAGLTVNQLRSHLQALRIQRDNATDPRVIKGFNRELQQTQLRIERMTTGMSRMAQTWRHMGTLANRYGAIVGWITMTFAGLGYAIFGTAKNFRELDKQFSNVMKSTSLTRSEVMKLKREFDEVSLSKIDGQTPTKTTDLLEIARIAGRLGVRGVKDISDFTFAVDKLYVALGEDLEGSVEEVAEKVGKLVNVFHLTDEMPLNEALLRAGSLINELGKRSAASAETILNYTSRLGGMGSMAKFSIDQLAGMGAALDSLGVPAERGSTAVTKLISALGTQAEMFARILGLPIEEYTEKLKTNANAVLLEIIKISAGGNESIMDVIRGMDAMDVNGVRVMETFSKLVERMDVVIEQQGIAAIAFSSSASVMNEFYVMSKDFDSLMAIQGKRIKSLADDYSKALSPAIYSVYRGMINFLYWLKDAAVWIKDHNRLIVGLATSWGVLRAAAIGKWVQGLIASLKVWGIELLRVTVAAYRNSVAVTTMNTAYVAAGKGLKGAWAALVAFNRALWTNPYTAVAAAIMAIAGGLYILLTRTNEVQEATDKLTESITSETSKMGFLFEKTKTLEKGTKQRADGIKLLNERYGEYLPNLLSEIATNEELAVAQDAANIKLKEKIALQWQVDEAEAIIQKNAEKRAKSISNFYNAVREKKGAGSMGLAISEVENLVAEMAKLQEAGKSLEADKLFEDFYGRWGEVMPRVMGQPMKKWNPNAPDVQYKQPIKTSLLRKEIETQIELYQKEQKILKELNEASAEFTKNEVTLQKIREGKEPSVTGMSDEIFNGEVARYKMMYDQERLLLMQSYSDKDALRKAELKAEEAHLKNLLDLTIRKWTAIVKVETAKLPVGATNVKDVGGGFSTYERMIGGEQEILDARLALQENFIAQKEALNKKDSDKADNKRKKDAEEEFAETKIWLLKMLMEKQINQDMYDTLMLEMEADFAQQMIAKEKKAGNDTLKWEEDYYNARLKLREKYEKQQDILNEAMAFMDVERKDEEDPQYDAGIEDWAEKYNAKRKAVRKFLSLDKNEDYESEFAVFDTDNFAGQLAQLDEWYLLAIIKEEEYWRRVNEITRNQSKKRLDYAKQGLEAFNELLGAFGNLYEAQKERELKAAGDNAQKQIEIQKKYARKEQAIAASQALISGALSVMRIWEAKATGNAIADAIIKGVLTAAMVVTTGVQLATIKAQQFAKGNYPVMGADDGRTYNAEFVGKPRTGIYRKPSLGLFAEKPEMVIDNPTLRNIQINSPGLISAIMAHRYGGVQGSEFKVQSSRTRQYAEGNYQGGVTGLDTATANRLISALEKFEKKKLVVYTELIKKDLDTLATIDKKREM